MSKSRKRERTHVVIGPGGRFQCMHCGGSHNPFPGNRDGVELWAMSALATAFANEHDACPKPEAPPCFFCLLPVHASDDHVNETTKAPGDWPACLDTGVSSEAIWHHMMGRSWEPVLRQHDNHPHDPQDLGRCLRLLAAPWAIKLGWRARLGEMAAYGAAWTRLAGAWEELEGLYRVEREAGENAPPQLHERMKGLLEGRVG
jgi:hypothetical protein